jgi:hypothetical protein
VRVRAEIRLAAWERHPIAQGQGYGSWGELGTAKECEAPSRHLTADQCSRWR